jgi:hypothetical protein
MALIKCAGCGHMISDKATKCPKCGCSITNEVLHLVPQEVPQEQHGYYKGENDDKTRKWLYVVIVALLVIIAGGCYSIYNYNNYNKQDVGTDNALYVCDSLAESDIVSTEVTTKTESEDLSPVIPSYEQVVKLWELIAEKVGYGDYTYSKVRRSNMLPLAAGINGLELLHCKVKETVCYGDGDSTDYYINHVPIVCYGINSKVTNIQYYAYSPEVSLIATSEHAFGLMWSTNEYQDHLYVYIKNESDAMAFSTQIEQNMQNEGVYTGHGEDLGFMIDSYNPKYENNWFVFPFRSF